MLRSTSSRLNNTMFSPASLAILLIVTLGAGCVSHDRRGEIPFGTWSGEGVFVYENWKQDGENAVESEPRSLSRRYSTSLIIRPRELDGHDVIELEIVSNHGGMPDMDKETHLNVALVEAKRVSESMTLYRLVDFKFNPAPDSTLNYEEDGPPYAASCITSNGTTIFQIEYMENFVDTFRFYGRHVEKAGVYFDPQEGLVHWYEDLTKQQ